MKTDLNLTLVLLTVLCTIIFSYGFKELLDIGSETPVMKTSKIVGGVSVIAISIIGLILTWFVLYPALT